MADGDVSFREIMDILIKFNAGLEQLKKSVFMPDGTRTITFAENAWFDIQHNKKYGPVIG